MRLTGRSLPRRLIQNLHRRIIRYAQGQEAIIIGHQVGRQVQMRQHLQLELAWLFSPNRSSR